MNSKLIIGVPLSLIAIVMVYNYINSPPVGFKNIRGSYDVIGGPFEGCVKLDQPGAGIKVFAHFGGANLDVNTLTGQVNGSTFNFDYKIAQSSGKAALAVSKTKLSGDWTGTNANGGVETGTWVFTKRGSECAE